ncbi:MAG: metal ABC transporter substrate-binding protein [Jiangellaceae bacterium]
MTIRGRSASVVALATVASLSFVGCGTSGTAASQSGPTVLTSFYPLAFLAERIAGPDATVENLTQPGVEPHDLELTGQQVGSIAHADLVLYLHGFQPAVDEAVEQNAASRSLDVAEIVDLLPAGEDEHEGEEEGHEHGGLEGDPHLWLDPTNVAAVSQTVADRLTELIPAQADAIHERADDLVAELTGLDREYESGLGRCERQVFVTSHAAFGYLADRYGLDMVGISGLSPDAEPSPARLAEVQHVVEEEGVTTIFYETLVSPQVAETLADDLAIDTAVLDPIEGLADDAADEDYFSLMRANLDALREANGCS